MVSLLKGVRNYPEYLVPFWASGLSIRFGDDWVGCSLGALLRIWDRSLQVGSLLLSLNNLNDLLFGDHVEPPNTWSIMVQSFLSSSRGAMSFFSLPSLASEVADLNCNKVAAEVAGGWFSFAEGCLEGMGCGGWCTSLVWLVYMLRMFVPT